MRFLKAVVKVMEADATINKTRIDLGIRNSGACAIIVGCVPPFDISSENVASCQASVLRGAVYNAPLM